MKIIERDGLIYLPITLKYDSKVYKINDCILDTGSAGTVIDIDFIQFNPKIPAVLKRLHGIGGHQDVVAQNVDFIKIDSIYLRNVLIEFGDINNSFGIKGILGTNLLKYMDFHLSFINKTIEFKNINV
ncbi:MAG: hypothetical protein OMM_10261 [Candidatus Magnetoglobus multicellularis str. Araruama]|jgi:hypothetical protein|uniref:Aspartyl protease n=1 Tax=Candidatus Magnetoglobus multicellularis str. Araruama TaxID=890399 RepID=A0A1V1P1R2_9BACT|nr:MAG: hypothetical protein OMM_10261 [Candidatus Magnetoglobus multicellularis str. Araruama]